LLGAAEGEELGGREGKNQEQERDEEATRLIHGRSVGG